MDPDDKDEDSRILLISFGKVLRVANVASSCRMVTMINVERWRGAAKANEGEFKELLVNIIQEAAQTILADSKG